MANVILKLMPKTLSLSVFFPAYNEEDNIKQTVLKATKVLTDLGADYEIIIVNDGSKDNTRQVAEALSSKNRNVRVVNHAKNQGYGGALISGFYSAKKSIIAFADGDGQFDFSEIKKFLPLLDQNDLVIGYRAKRAEGLGRHLLAQALRFWDLFLFGIWFKDIDCAFKVIKRPSLQKLPRLESRTAMISTELLVKAKKAGLKIKEISVTHLPDMGNKNRRARGAHPRIIFRAVKGTIDLWFSLRRLPPRV